jgi:hypothetical protein
MSHTPTQPTQTNRLLYLDFLRGLMLIGITLGHFGPTFEWLMWQPLGFFSNAEGFVLLSGTVFGLVYAKLEQRDPASMAVKARKRAWLIYLSHLGLLLFVALYTWATNGWADDWRSHAQFIAEAPALGLILGTLLIYQPPLLDILPMYALFVLIAPGIIRQLVAGRVWLVLGVSLVIWWLFSQVIGGGHWRTTIADSLGMGFPFQVGEFDPLTWQVLFFFGTALGVRMFQQRLPRQPQIVLALIAMVAVVLFFGLRHELIAAPAFWNPAWVDRHELAWLRLVNIAALIYTFWTLLYLARKVNWPAWALTLPKPFACLGRHSLAVFSAHVVLIYLTIPIQMTYPLLWRYVIGLSLIFILLALACGLDIRARRQRQTQLIPAR